MATLTFYKYITDNPFRLCNVSSRTPLVELRKRASKLKQQISVGVTPIIGLSEVFGTDEAEHCVDIVRRISNEPEELNLYRFFWPSVYESDWNITGIDNFAGILKGERQAQRDSAPSLYNGTTILVDHHTQSEHSYDFIETQFLDAWYHFLVDPNASNLSETFNSLAKIHDAFDVADDDSDLRIEPYRSHTDKMTPVQGAIRFVLDTSSRIASEEWQKTPYPTALNIIQSICNAPFANDFIDIALRNIIVLGDREAENLEILRLAYRGWDATRGFNDLVRPQNLIYLAETIGNRSPSAFLWQRDANRYVDNVVSSIRQTIVENFNQDGNIKKAQSSLNELLWLPVTDSWHARIRKDIDELDTIAVEQESQRHREQAPRQQQRIRETPTQKQSPVFAWGCLAVIVFSIVCVVNEPAPSQKASTPSATTPSPAINIVNDSTATVDGTADLTERNTRHERLKVEYEELTATIKEMDSEIAQNQSTIDDARLSLHELLTRLNERDQNLDLKDPSAVNSYNNDVEYYNQQKDDFNRQVEDANLIVNARNDKFQRYTQVRAALLEMEKQ